MNSIKIRPKPNALSGLCNTSFVSVPPEIHLIDRRRPFIKAGRWLRRNANRIDPKTTHLEAVLPLIREIKRKTLEALPEKSGQKNYAINKKLIDTVLSEIDQRIEAKQVTYEWAFGLPYRLGFLLKMDGPPSILEGMDVPYVLEAQHYASHENFMGMLTRYMDDPSERADKRFTPIGTIVGELKSFPQNPVASIFWRSKRSST